MPNQGETLDLPRCPHCSIDKPNLVRQSTILTQDDRRINNRNWYMYSCARCGGVVTAFSYPHSPAVIKYYPEINSLDDELPEKVRYYLQQAIDSTFAPAGSTMLSASAVDALLKDKGYIQGSLYNRIQQAVANGLLTREMADWAHQVRLDANDQRHVDEDAKMPTIEDAKLSIEFVRTIAEFVYVLPARVTRGIQRSQSN